MKRLILISALLFTISACGPSQKDKDIAAAACSEIMETFKIEEAKRIRIYNDARLELDMRPITSRDSKFVFEVATRYGGFDSCMEQFFPPTAKELEQRRIAREKSEKIEEEKRIKRKARLSWSPMVKKKGSKPPQVDYSIEF